MSMVSIVRFKECSWYYLATIEKWDENTVTLSRCVAFKHPKKCWFLCSTQASPQHSMRQALEYARDLIQSCERTDEWNIGVERGSLGSARFCVTEGGSSVARIQRGNVVSGELHLPNRHTVWCIAEDETISEKEFAERQTNQDVKILLWYVQCQHPE